MPMQATNEDLEGYFRGAHRDGPEVCDGFVFHVPGSSSTPEKTVWGWNDVDALFCAKCKRHAHEHIVLREPPKPKEVKPKPRLPAALPPTADPTSIPFDPDAAKHALRQQAASINGGYDPSGMLTEDNDPLAVNARPRKPAPPAEPTPTPPPPLSQGPPPEAAAPPPAPAPLPTKPSELAEGVRDPALQELLARDASANEAFKREVERMVREAARRDELDARLRRERDGASGQDVTQREHQGSRTIIAASRDLSGAAVPKGTFTDSAALLRAVGLPQYEKLFEEEEMDPDTLIEVLEQQGKASLEEALKELEIKSMGHRLKIINALVVQ